MKHALALLLFASCAIFAPASPPRVSTAEERSIALDYLSTASKLLEAARISGLDPAKYDLGLDLIAKLRSRIDQSEKVPTTWHVLIDDAIDLSLRWVPAKK